MAEDTQKSNIIDCRTLKVKTVVFLLCLVLFLLVSYSTSGWFVFTRFRCRFSYRQAYEEQQWFNNKREYNPYDWGNPVQFDGSNTLSKQGIPSVGMAPDDIKNINDINYNLNVKNQWDWKPH